MLVAEKVDTVIVDGQLADALAAYAAHPEQNGGSSQEPYRIVLRVALLPLAA